MDRSLLGVFSKLLLMNSCVTHSSPDFLFLSVSSLWIKDPWNPFLIRDRKFRTDFLGIQRLLLLRNHQIQNMQRGTGVSALPASYASPLCALSLTFGICLWGSLCPIKPSLSGSSGVFKECWELIKGRGMAEKAFVCSEWGSDTFWISFMSQFTAVAVGSAGLLKKFITLNLRSGVFCPPLGSY